MIENEINRIASHCRHYAMCKIDYLGTGICPAAIRKPYVAYFPQGRMDIYDALSRNLIPFSIALLDIADTCSLCGICDLQCHFVTGLRPLKVMKALKDKVEAYRKQRGKAYRAKKDSVLTHVRKIVGPEWVSNDPAILITYANDPFPMSRMRMPRYVTLPGSTDEISAIVEYAEKERIPFAVRGNGSSVYGKVFSEGIVLDMNRLKEIKIDPQNWSAEVGAGVTSFELQKKAMQEGFRANAAEPAATVCGNIICTGMFSTWAASYGLAADNLIDMEFVGSKGQVFRFGENSAGNLLTYKHGTFPAPGVCTRATVRLHPVGEDEEGLVVPFCDFKSSLLFVRELSRRGIGFSIAILGPHYLATFLSPSLDLSEKAKKVFPEDLGISFAAFVITDRFGRESIRQMAESVINTKLLTSLVLGLPNLVKGEWREIIRGSESDRPPYHLLCKPEMQELLDTVLDPSPETLAGAVEEDLKETYTSLYRRPELTDSVWLTSCRILSARMGRKKHIIAFVLFLPLLPELIESLCTHFAQTAETIGLDHAFGFLTPLDLGKRAILEYDYYIDQVKREDQEKAATAIGTLVPWLDELALRTPGLTWMKTLFGQGFVRKESFLYTGLKARKEE